MPLALAAAICYLPCVCVCVWCVAERRAYGSALSARVSVPRVCFYFYFYFYIPDSGYMSGYTLRYFYLDVLCVIYTYQFPFLFRCAAVAVAWCSPLLATANCEVSTTGYWLLATPGKRKTENPEPKRLV